LKASRRQSSSAGRVVPLHPTPRTGCWDRGKDPPSSLICRSLGAPLSALAFSLSFTIELADGQPPRSTELDSFKLSPRKQPVYGFLADPSQFREVARAQKSRPLEVFLSSTQNRSPFVPDQRHVPRWQLFLCRKNKSVNSIRADEAGDHAWIWRPLASAPSLLTPNVTARSGDRRRDATIQEMSPTLGRKYPIRTLRLFPTQHRLEATSSQRPKQKTVKSPLMLRAHEPKFRRFVGSVWGLIAPTSSSRCYSRPLLSTPSDLPEKHSKIDLFLGLI
jgi:hypothetical protein